MLGPSGISFRARDVLEALRTSLWAVPGTSVVLALAVSYALPYLERAYWRSQGDAWYAFGGEVESSRELLSTIATSILGLTGVVFSVTVLVLQLASSQFSPRVLRTFLDDRTTQVTMGFFLGTFTYCIALLPRVRIEEGGGRFVPALAIWVAYAAVLGSVGLFVRYIHHMAHAIRAVSIIQRIGQETRQTLDQIHPPSHPYEPDRMADLPSGAPTQICCNPTRGGVVRAIDERALVALASQHHARIALTCRPGDFVPEKAPLAQVWGTASLSEDELRVCVDLADERTAHQDPAFGFRQLVDIAERALSPGVNDPTTAVQVLDQLHDLLRTLARRKLASAACIDERGELRVIVPRQSFQAYVGLALDEIRQYGAESIQVTRRIREILEDLLTVTPPERQGVLQEQLELLDHSLETAFHTAAERQSARVPSAQGHGP